MSKKSTTVQTGLGDQQYQTLANNQSNIAGGINDLSTKATEGFNTVTANQKQMTDNQTTLYNQADENKNTIVGNQDALKTGQSGLATTQQQILTAVQNAPTVDLSGVTSSINSLQGTTDAGFTKMGTRFDGVDTALTGLGTQMTTGFDGVNKKVDAGFETVNTNMTAGFDTAETNAQARADAAQESRDALQEAVLTGQVGLTELIDKYGAAGATYYEALAGNQAQMQETMGGMQEGLNAFQDQYTTDFATQSQFLGDLAGTVEGGFDAVREGQTQVSDSVANQLQNSVAPSAAQQQAQAQLAFQTQMQQQLAQINQNIASGQIDYSQIAKQVSTGQSSGNPAVDAAATQEWTGQLNTIRQMLNDQTIRMDDRLRNNYSQLSSSFDQSGKLVASSVDQNGVKTARAIDENGQLLIAQFDATGQQLMQNSLDINSMMYSLKQQFSAGANYSMGNLSPAMNKRFGLMSPYAQSGEYYRG